ncbi:formate/nitrite transporter family protein [Micromonospora sp. WMMD980]|uniref:formate/nitrite transporter family protein n=1 Tax=Micromonospora sp. WMMD980 TaxID=3016088 RepID=UPI002417E618|nr:formate/nitrite transporter family protein [Micromonospora sp. WMMD980]MDG4803758.1 formate/nitrite transporter family protein [Micromonospora sp. WMMD980]
MNEEGRTAGWVEQAAPERPEPELEEAYDRLVEEGETRLARPWPPLIATALLGGIDVGTGVLAYLLVEHATGQPLLAGLAFSVGFVALLLARSELFTENFLVPVTAVAARRKSLGSLLRLWVVTLAGNLVSGWLLAWLIVTGLPELRETAIETGRFYAELGINLRSFVLAVLAGMVITLMTRMQHATDSLGVRLVPALLLGALLAGGQLLHSVLDSILMFAALATGRAPFGYLDWLGVLGWSVLGNVVGGVGLVAFLRLIRVEHRLLRERAEQSRAA